MYGSEKVKLFRPLGDQINSLYFYLMRLLLFVHFLKTPNNYKTWYLTCLNAYFVSLPIKVL